MTSNVDVGDVELTDSYLRLNVLNYNELGVAATIDVYQNGVSLYRILIFFNDSTTY